MFIVSDATLLRRNVLFKEGNKRWLQYMGNSSRPQGTGSYSRTAAPTCNPDEGQLMLRSPGKLKKLNVSAFCGVLCLLWSGTDRSCQQRSGFPRSTMHTFKGCFYFFPEQSREIKWRSKCGWKIDLLCCPLKYRQIEVIHLWCVNVWFAYIVIEQGPSTNTLETLQIHEPSPVL